MTKKCFDDFASTVGKVLDNSEKENLLQKVRSNKEQLRIDGKEIDTTVGDKTALQVKLDREFQIKTKNTVDNTIRRLSTETQLKTRFEELDSVADTIIAKDGRVTRQKAYQRAFISLIYNTNDTTDIPLESIEKSLFQNSLGEFLSKTTSQIGSDPIKFIQKY